MLRTVSLFLLLLTMLAEASAQSDPSIPFPGNRVRDYYRRQADQFLSSGLKQPQDLLPQFPGLDGGGFGHWGQNPEDASFDRSLNGVRTGNVICQLTRHFNKVTPKAVTVLLDQKSGTSVLFDPERLTFTDTWTEGFVEWGFVRFGLMQGVEARGRQIGNAHAARWIYAAETPTRYLGFYRCNEDVVFSSQIGNAGILEHAELQDGWIIRTLNIHGSLPADTVLVLSEISEDTSVRSVQSAKGQALRIQRGDQTQTVLVQALEGTAELFQKDARIGVRVAAGEHVVLRIAQSADEVQPVEPIPEIIALQPVSELLTTLQNGEYPANCTARWAAQTVTTKALPGDPQAQLIIDTLTLPHYPDNPFGSAMRIGGVGVLSDGRIVVATLMGEVWLFSGTDQISNGGQLKWQRIASGLYRALGLTVQNDKILVLGSDQITRLHDLNGDDEIDFYECLTNAYPTTGGHDFCTSLQQDAQGELYWSVSARDFGVAHRNSAGQIRSLGSGLRNSNGIGVSPDGQVVLATVQEGTWTPATAIFEVGPKSYHGLQGPRPDHGTYGYDLPLCYIPRGIDNSSGEIRYLPADPRLGPLSGAVLGTSFGACQTYLVLRDVVNGQPQGAVVPLPGDYLSGVCRTAFSPHDGCIYIAGTEGWQSYAEQDGCLQRIRIPQQAPVVPQTFETWNNGIRIRFSEPLDPVSVTTDNLFCQQWNYLYSAAYGSPEFSVREPARQGHDYVPVKSVQLLADGRSVFVEIPQLHPVMQFHVHARFRSAAGQPVQPDVFATILNQREDFREFTGYAAVEKRAAPGFPRPEAMEQDPRLTEQEQYGTNFGWVSSSVKMSIEAAPGLQYTPQVLRVAPRTRVSLAFHNADPGMPHNVAVVRADAVQEFGTRSMQLASNPRAIASHYVPDDPREICFSPILQPGDTYTMFFEAPEEPGEYRLICTYPGHWRVMQATLHVIADGAELPETSIRPTRSFVRMWSLDDLAAAAESLPNASQERGSQIFQEAGCIRCHRMHQEGSQLGPDLTTISRRFHGSRLLQQILQPSLEINKEFQTMVAVMEDGRALSGIRVTESDTEITLLPDPLQPEASVTFRKSELDELVASSISTMPANLLITFSEQEILDLLFYLQQGNRNPAPQPEN